MASTISKRWKDIDPKEHEFFKKQADEDLKMYLAAMKVYNEQTQRIKKHRVAIKTDSKKKAASTDRTSNKRKLCYKKSDNNELDRATCQINSGKESGCLLGEDINNSLLGTSITRHLYINQSKYLLFQDCSKHEHTKQNEYERIVENEDDEYFSTTLTDILKDILRDDDIKKILITLLENE